MRLRNLTQSSSLNTTKYISRKNAKTGKISKYLTHPFVYFLLLGICFDCSGAATVGDYLPVGAQLTLPQGFTPQQAPTKPMLLPFVTPAPNNPFDGWRPIVGNVVKPTHRITRMPTPMLLMVAPTQSTTMQDCIDTSKEHSSTQLEEGPLLESIVYGTWKPERPLTPEEMQASSTPNPRADRLKTTVKKIGRPSSKKQPANFDTQAADPNFVRKIESSRGSTTPSHKTTLSSSEFINFNGTDANLLEISKQTNRKLPQPSKNPNLHDFDTFPKESTTEAETITESVTLPIDVQKVWPTDFVPTLEQDKQNHKLLTKKLNNSFEKNVSYRLNNLNVRNIADTVLPQIPLNITKVGVPYEIADSAEEPKICVPITIIEELSQLEIERVYCFPLPSPYSTEASKSNGLEIKVKNYTEYEDVSAGEKLSISFMKTLCFTFMILYFLRDKYF
ncbi:uncharacterized protein [Eurosta solidaginis]